MPQCIIFKYGVIIRIGDLLYNHHHLYFLKILISCEARVRPFLLVAPYCTVLNLLCSPWFSKWFSNNCAPYWFLIKKYGLSETFHNMRIILKLALLRIPFCSLAILVPSDVRTEYMHVGVLFSLQSSKSHLIVLKLIKSPFFYVEVCATVNYSHILPRSACT